MHLEIERRIEGGKNGLRGYQSPATTDPRCIAGKKAEERKGRTGGDLGGFHFWTETGKRLSRGEEGKGFEND